MVVDGQEPAATQPVYEPLTPVDLLLPGAWRAAVPPRPAGGEESRRAPSPRSGGSRVVRSPATLPLPLGELFPPDTDPVVADEAGPVDGSQARVPVMREPGQVAVDPAAYVGRPVDEVHRELLALGLRVLEVPDVRSSRPRGEVVNLRPTGRVDLGSTVQVFLAW